MTATIAVTGGSGFVGSHLVARLSEGGHDLRLLMRGGKRPPPEDVHVVSGDLADRDALDELCAGAEILVHCAGLITARTAAEYDAVNSTATVLLVERARRAGVRRIILLSSLAAREPNLSSYGASKHRGEQALVGISEPRWVILRPPAVYGPGDRGTLPLVDQLRRRLSLIPGHHDARVSLIHVVDLVSAIDHLIADASIDGRIVELDDGRRGGYSWEDLKVAATGEKSGRCLFIPRPLLSTATAGLGFWSGLTGAVPMLTPGKVAELYHRDWVCRNDLLDELTEWSPNVPFARGFSETLAWYRAEGWLS
ncbi:nucleoside-diphosphate-sugar epimerase [Rhodoligotrophos appendicifer]|uniref:NAD-dependent epimerase/dehydratase family protein n=1 Tax=Rhodoligotrophos appendicifer TaxID=987056 RepID=UPI0011851265|nr:NAD-dependent epimerase/dehydratase family protein [Rhodoligotrophos appendicifer]